MVIDSMRPSTVTVELSRVLEDETPVVGSVALTLSRPRRSVVISPLLPAALLTRTIDASLFDQSTRLVMSASELSLNVPIALSDRTNPTGSETSLGSTRIRTTRAGTVTRPSRFACDDDRFPTDAEIRTVPGE